MNNDKSIIIDPLAIKQSDCPLVILLDDRRGLLGFLIKAHSKGNYSHIAEMHISGFVATQDPVGFREVPIEKYMRPQYHLKFWKYEPITEEQRQDWVNTLKNELNAPWRRRRYDFLGIIGHMLHIRWLNNPFIKYCTERVAEHMRDILQLVIPKRRNPSEMNKVFHEIRGMKILGYYFE